MAFTGILATGGIVYVGLKTYRRLSKKQNLLYQSLTEEEAQTSLATSTRHTMASAEMSQDHVDPLAQRRATNHYLAASSVGLGLALVGAVGYPLVSLLSVPVSLYAYGDILRAGYHALFKERRLRAAVLDSIITFGLVISGYYIATALSNCVYFLGVRLLLQTEDASRQSLTNLFGEQPRLVWRLVDGAEVATPFEAIQRGDVVVVNAGEMIPVDGRIVQGIASVDQQKLTGESQPVDKTPGDHVLAATLVLAGQLYIEVEKAGTETIAAQIGEILSRTADFKATIEARSQQIADKSVLPTLGAGLLALLTLNPIKAIATISANYSEILRIAGPLGMLNFLHLATENGILVKDGRSLELLTEIDTVVFDKTGTLTLEQPSVGQIHCCADLSADEVLVYAATAEYRQTHPIARAILQAAPVWPTPCCLG